MLNIFQRKDKHDQKAPVDDFESVPAYIANMQDEHKYISELTRELKQQLAEYSIGKEPDYVLIAKTVEHMQELPQKFDAEQKVNMINTLIELDPEKHIELETLLSEKHEIQNVSAQVVAALTALLRKHDTLQDEELKIFLRNYVELFESHIQIEQKVLFPLMEKYLSSTELKQFAEVSKIDIKQILEQDFSSVLGDRYDDISLDIKARWEGVEEAATDFALSEFFSIGALFESIEPLSISSAEISSIIKRTSQAMLSTNKACCIDLLSKRQSSGSDYLEKPISAALDCFEAYVTGMSEIGSVLKQTKNQVYEPYTSRKAYFSVSNQTE